MPIPKPHKGEAKADYISRCAGDTVMNKDYPDSAQRLAVCEQQWRDKEKDAAAAKKKSHALPERYDGRFIIDTLIVRKEGDATPVDLPPGCCAKMVGSALVYNVTDDYGTRFAPGCLAQTVAEKVRTGKVRLFADHDPRTHTHVGTVTDLKDVGDTAQMTAVIFDTKAGREMKEYLEAVTQSGAVTGAATGLSVGFRSRDDETIHYEDENGEMQWACLFKEIELREISITPVNAVPGSDVLAVRREEGDEAGGLLRRMLRRILAQVPEREARALLDEAYASGADRTDTPKPDAPSGATPPDAPSVHAAPGSESAPVAAPVVASLEERRKILREILGAAAGVAAT